MPRRRRAAHLHRAQRVAPTSNTSSNGAPTALLAATNGCALGAHVNAAHSRTLRALHSTTTSSTAASTGTAASTAAAAVFLVTTYSKTPAIPPAEGPRGRAPWNPLRAVSQARHLLKAPRAFNSGAGSVRRRRAAAQPGAAQPGPDATLPAPLLNAKEGARWRVAAAGGLRLRSPATASTSTSNPTRAPGGPVNDKVDPSNNPCGAPTPSPSPRPSPTPATSAATCRRAHGPALNLARPPP